MLCLYSNTTQNEKSAISFVSHSRLFLIWNDKSLDAVVLLSFIKERHTITAVGTVERTHEQIDLVNE